MADIENTPCCIQDGLLSTKVTLRVKPEKDHPRGGARERRGISVGAADYDEDNSCAELADRDMEILVVRPGKDVRGLYPGQVGRVHQTYVFRGAPGPFSRLQPAPVNYKARTPFQPDFDNSAHRNYVHFQKIVRKPTADWYNQTSYKAAFDLPYLKTNIVIKESAMTAKGKLRSYRFQDDDRRSSCHALHHHICPSLYLKGLSISCMPKPNYMCNTNGKAKRCENKHTPTTVPVPYTTWNRVFAQRMFSAFQVYT